MKGQVNVNWGFIIALVIAAIIVLISIQFLRSGVRGPVGTIIDALKGMLS